MSALRINSLHIEGFRGLNQPIEFDLSSPITLLFAPNGTGKTTVCEAVEWLLTAQVERLRDQTFNPNLLRSVFGETAREPFVRAALQIGEEPLDLTRTLEGGWFEQSPVGKPAKIGTLLATLAPAAAAPDAHHKTAIALRQNWLRGTRFLSFEALSALVDTDDASVERRKQVFADLLGIRHLLDAERSCLRYVEELDGFERGVAQTLREGEAQIIAIKREIGDESAEPNAGATDTIATEIARAEQGLGLPAPANAADPQGFAERIESALIVYGRQDRARAVQQGALDQALATFARRQTLVAETETLARQIEALTAEVSDAETKGRAKAGECARLSTERTRVAELRRQLNGAAPEIVERFGALVEKLGAAGAPHAQNWPALQRAVPESAWASQQVQARLDELGQALTGAETLAGELETVEAMRLELEQATALAQSGEQMAALDAAVKNAEADLQTARAHADSVLGPVERIRSAGQDFVAHTHDGDSSDCPLCGHDWASVEALRRAIRAVTSAAPELASSLQTIAKAREDAARSARTRLQAAIAQLATVDRLRARFNGASVSLDQKRRAIARLGLDPADPNLAGAMRAMLDRTNLALAMAELAETIAAHASVLDLSQLFAPERPLSRGFGEVQGLIVARGGELDFMITNATTQETNANREREALRLQYTDKQQRLAGARTRSTETAGQLAALAAVWATAAPGQDWTEPNMIEAQKRLADDAARLAGIDTYINAAKSALERENRIVRLRTLEETLKPVRARRRRMRARLGAGRSAAKTFSEAYERISKAQIRALSAVVNPLFARMHANRVVDVIGLGEDDNFLHWSATAGEAQLDPKTNFSQGQRQDLALALFLARARSLGGTFFLDEPVAHLDDLNRVGLLDVLRVAVLEKGANLSLVITTASRTLARHLVEKFSNVGSIETPLGRQAPLKVIEITGNARTGVSRDYVYPASA